MSTHTLLFVLQAGRDSQSLFPATHSHPLERLSLVLDILPSLPKEKFLKLSLYIPSSRESDFWVVEVQLSFACLKATCFHKTKFFYVSIEHLQVQFPKDGDEFSYKCGFEVKDDQNKSNDHHQISNNGK